MIGEIKNMPCPIRCVDSIAKDMPCTFCGWYEHYMYGSVPDYRQPAQTLTNIVENTTFGDVK